MQLVVLLLLWRQLVLLMLKEGLLLWTPGCLQCMQQLRPELTDLHRQAAGDGQSNETDDLAPMCYQYGPKRTVACLCAAATFML
jgi:hypothetical protein